MSSDPEKAVEPITFGRQIITPPSCVSVLSGQFNGAVDAVDVRTPPPAGSSPGSSEKICHQDDCLGPAPADSIGSDNLTVFFASFCIYRIQSDSE
jgi:hypothetical protein